LPTRAHRDTRARFARGQARAVARFSAFENPVATNSLRQATSRSVGSSRLARTVSRASTASHAGKEKRNHRFAKSETHAGPQVWFGATRVPHVFFSRARSDRDREVGRCW